MKIIPFLLIFSFINLHALESNLSDLFKISSKNNNSVLFIHSKINPKIIRNGKNVSLLFENSNFVKDCIIPFDNKFSALKRIKIKNYKQKGGAINLIVNNNVDFKIKRISPDVVKILVLSKHIFVKKSENIQKNSTKKTTVVANLNKKNVVKKDNVIIQKNITKKEVKLQGVVEKKEKNNVKKDNLSFLFNKKENKSVEKTDNTMKIYAIAFLFLGFVAAIFYNKKRGKNFINNNNSLMKIVEALPLGLKEKLVLLDVAGNYVLLFVKDKDVKELTMFSGDKAKNITALLNQTEEDEDIFKDFQNDKIMDFAKEKKERKSVSFSDKLSQMVANEKKNRTTESTTYNDDLESELYKTISKLKKMRIS